MAQENEGTHIRCIAGALDDFARVCLVVFSIHESAHVARPKSVKEVFTRLLHRISGANFRVFLYERLEHKGLELSQRTQAVAVRVCVQEPDFPQRVAFGGLRSQRLKNGSKPYEVLGDSHFAPTHYKAKRVRFGR